MDKHIAVLLVIMAITIVFFRANDLPGNRKICVSAVTVIMACFSGFRTWWMGDLIKYYSLYTQCNGEEWVEKVLGDYANIGIRLFFRGMGFLGVSYDICIFMIAAFSAISLGILIYRYSPAPYWSYLMYITMGFYLFTYSGLKQTIAMGFLMFAVIGIFESKPKNFLIWTLVASVFHVPALVFLIAYPVAKKKIDANYFIILAIAVLCIFIFREQILSWATSFYYEEERLYTAAKTIGGRALMMILIIVLGAILRPARRGDKIYCQVLNLIIIAAMIQYFSIYGNVFTRLADYYYQFIVLFMPMMMESGAHQLKTQKYPSYRVRCYNSFVYTLLAIGITLFALWFYHSTINGAQGFLQNYKFFWQIDPYSLYGK